MESPTHVVPLTESDTSCFEDSRCEQLLVKTLNAFSHWRTNKKRPAEPIPTELWQQIFALEQWYEPSQLRNFFNVSTKQYATKKTALISKKDEALELCEVNVIKENKAPKKSEVKLSPYTLDSLPSAKTLVVEFCRSDGQVMKIHTTQDSIPALLQTFLGGEVPC